jgi:hypothetical protein
MNNAGIKVNLLELLIRLFYGIVIGCAIGVIGGLVFGIASGWINSATSQFLQEELDILPGDISTFIGYGVFIIGLPVGFLVGVTTGLNLAIFQMSSIKPFVWAGIAGSGVVISLWISHFSENHFIFQALFYFEVALVSFITGWVAYKYITLYFANGWDEYSCIDLDDLSKSMPIMKIIGLTSELFFIMITTYYYFEILYNARNIHT